MRQSLSCLHTFPLILFFLAASLTAKEPPDRFRISVAGGRITGTEFYGVTKTTEGFLVESTVNLNRPGGQVEMIQTLTLTPDYQLVQYKLEAKVGGQTQIIEALREGEQVRLRVSANGRTSEKTVEHRPNTVVLDNLVVSHYQVLLNQLDPGDTPPQEWWALVPQRMAASTAKLTRGENETGQLNGKTIAVNKYTLEIGGTLIVFWAEKNSHKLMRITVPIQNIEMVREGFILETKLDSEPEEQTAYFEREVIVTSNDFQLPGTICLPRRGAPPFPIVVLVHGSGPLDRDETIGPNKPFRDLALGLAERGIASLRYDKRTFAFREKLDAKTITLEDEVLADAVAALETARELAGIDPERVFILGHSLGATMAPFLAERTPFLKGMVLLAALARPIDETILEQTAFRSRVAGKTEEQIDRQQENLRHAFERIRSGDAADDEMVLFASARYWRDFLRHDVPYALRRIQTPVLVLQGGKDYQVTRTDYELILKALEANSTAQYESRWYPNLNHLFMSVKEESTGAEYGRAGHIDQGVLDNIADWIGNLSPRNQTPKALPN